MLSLPRHVVVEVMAQAVAEAPLECCGLLAGDPATGVVAWYHRCGNAAASAQVYTVDSRDLLRASRAADDAGLELIGVLHSHTHTPPYPSATDIAQAPDPSWHFAIVSLADAEPSLRSFRIVDGAAIEEPIRVFDAR